MSRLHILDNNIPESDNILYIDQSTEGYPFLAYREDNGSIINSITEGNSYDRPIHCSELINLLLSINPGNKFIASSSNPDLYFIFPTDDTSYQEIPTTLISKINPRANIRPEIDGFTKSGVDNISIDSLKSIKICSDYSDIIDELNNELDNILDRIYPTYPTDTAEDINYEKEIRDTVGPYSAEVMTDSVVVNLISETTYTDTVDLNKLARKVSEVGISGKADISVLYTKEKYYEFSNPRARKLIYSQMISIKVFEYLATGDLYIPNYISKLGNDIQLEYFNGILRVIPISENIKECIISDCTVTYGNLEMKKL